jgi:hypothetical protein
MEKIRDAYRSLVKKLGRMRKRCEDGFQGNGF